MVLQKVGNNNNNNNNNFLKDTIDCIVAKRIGNMHRMDERQTRIITIIPRVTASVSLICSFVS